MTYIIIDSTQLERFIEEFTSVLRLHSEELTGLDQAIGDGDHGLNMDRGFAAVNALSTEISSLPLDQALKKMGMTLVMNVGGASGPLYGSFFMGMAKVAPEKNISLANFVTMLKEGIDAVKSRGKSEAGQKTMLEVLVPLLEALQGMPEDAISAARTATDKGLESTREMLATKGRASFLGERSIGHIDPGARSSALLIHTACDIIEESK